MTTTTTGSPVQTTCGHDYPKPGPQGGAAGYARTRDGEILCYPCADARQRSEMAESQTDFYAYVSGDGERITTWSGGLLASITSHGYSRRGAYGGLHYWTATDTEGRKWWGRNGGSGMHIRLHLSKSSRNA